MGWQAANHLEMQRSYMIKSPRRNVMKLNIVFQSALGLTRIFLSLCKLSIVCCMGIALIQTFHVRNSSPDPTSQDNWHFTSCPHLAWIATACVGLVLFFYGFLGIWLCERRRKIWRITLHRIFLLFFKKLRSSPSSITPDPFLEILSSVKEEKSGRNLQSLQDLLVIIHIMLIQHSFAQ